MLVGFLTEKKPNENATIIVPDEGTIVRYLRIIVCKISYSTQMLNYVGWKLPAAFNDCGDSHKAYFSTQAVIGKASFKIDSTIFKLSFNLTFKLFLSKFPALLNPF